MRFGTVQLVDNAKLVFSKSANTVGIKAPASITNSYEWTLPSDLPGTTRMLVVSSTGVISYQDIGGGGSVTSVALSLPSIFTVSGSPVTTSGTLSATLTSQSANLVLASPSGASGTPTFRAIAWADVSSLAGTSSNSFAVGNDSRLHTQNTDTGTTSTSFQIDSGNTGVRLKHNTGVLEVRNSGDTAFADIRVNNLFVTGTTTTINSETITIDDNILVLNNNVSTGTPTEDLGIEGRRGGSTSASLKWNESTDFWTAGLLGSELQLARVYQTTFTNASLTGGILTVTHNLGNRFPNVVIADNTNKLIGAADDITYTSTSALSVDLTSFGSITGTWTISVIG